jgi:hypothetical protein
VLPARLTGHRYRNFLQLTLPTTLEHMPTTLEHMPLITGHNMWFMGDRHPAYACGIACNYTDKMYPGLCIGGHDPVSWPPRTPSLIPINFLLWGSAKNIVYFIKFQSPEDLWQRTDNALESNHHIPGVFECVRESLRGWKQFKPAVNL